MCGSCGAKTKVIGYEVNTVLNVKSAEYFLQVTKREKRTFNAREDQGLP